MTNTEKLAALNVFRAAEGKDAIVAWKNTRHQPMLDAYVAAAEAAKPAAPAVEFELTENEFHAAMVLVLNDCLNGMGGERPLDLDNDPYTWVYADTLVKFGWSKESAAGTFASLDAKGVIYAEGDESTLSTNAYRWLDTKWDEFKTIAMQAKADEPKSEEVAAPVAKPAAAAKTQKAAKTPAVEQNGIKAPRAGGLCAQAWAMFDELGHAVDIKAALAEGAKRGFNDNNIRTEICRWRKFNGIAARAKKA